MLFSDFSIYGSHNCTTHVFTSLVFKENHCIILWNSKKTKSRASNTQQHTSPFVNQFILEVVIQQEINIIVLPELSVYFNHYTQ